MAEFPFRKNQGEPDSGELSTRLEKVRDYCLDKTGSVEDFPFGPEVMVFKAVKIFAFVAWEKDPLTISLKCDPDRSLQLRAEYEAITGGYHLNKKHWNTVVLDETVPDSLVWELIDHSYDLIVASLTRKQREAWPED